MKKKLIITIIILLTVTSIFVLLILSKSNFSFPMQQTEKEPSSSSEEKKDENMEEETDKQDPSSDQPEKEDTENNSNPEMNPNLNGNNKPLTKPDKENIKEETDKQDPPSNTEEEPEPPTQEELNNAKRVSLQKKYGFTLIYGDEIGDYKPKRIDPIRLTNPHEINKVLTRLENELVRWPKGIFQDAINKGMPLKIYLIERDPTGSFAGVVDKQFMSDIKMTLTNVSNFSYIFNHEMMHYLEAYISICAYNHGGTFPLWNSMNPPDFVYGTTRPAYVFHQVKQPRGTYFIEDYGQSSEGEDRATIFAIAATKPYAPIGCFEKGQTIRNKADYIAQEIQKYFPSVQKDTTEIWERFLN